VPGDLCPRCPTALVSAREATPWCPACEWRLDVFEQRGRPPEFGWTWVDAITHRAAYRLNQRQFEELADESLTLRRWTPARVVTLTASVLLLVAVGATAGLGGWLVLQDFPGFTILPGLVLLLIAGVLRPRLGRVPEGVVVLDRVRAPTLFALVDRVCATSGAAPPHLIGVDDDMGAWTSTVGFRSRRVLCLGLPFWATLDAQERVALVGHEIGHFVNGDLRRGPLTQMALRTLGELSHMIRPGSAAMDAGFLGWVVIPVQWAVSAMLFVVHVALLAVGQRDAQRAEYLADELAATAGGTDAAVRLLDMVLLGEVIDAMIRRESRKGQGADVWRTAARRSHVNSTATIVALHQLTQRDEASLFASHPPTGLRAAMLRRRSARTASVVLAAHESALIDAELAELTGKLQRSLALG
jgi:Zn-dependent protease with chaperone function